MNTEEIMELALALAGLDDVPADSQIYHPGEEIERILLGIDIGSAELWLAKELGYDAIHDTVHEMCKDEARHGQAFAGLLKRYFG
jgi:hypothetical protein